MIEKIKEFKIMEFILTLAVVFPILTYAVTTPTNFEEFIMIIVDLIVAVLPIIILLAFFYFLWGLAQYLKNAGENKDEAIQMMLNGIIGFFVMASIWSLVNILVNTLGTDTQIPDLRGADQYWSGDGVKDSVEEFNIPN